MKKLIYIMGVCLVIVVLVGIVLNINSIKQTVALEVVHNQKAYKRASIEAKAVLDNGTYSEWFPSEKNIQRVVDFIDYRFN